MTDDAELEKSAEHDDQNHRPTLQSRSALQAFQQQQRLLASFGFSALTDLQRAVSQLGVNQTLQAIQESVNFSAFQEIARVLLQIPRTTLSLPVQADVIDSLASSLDLGAITRANKLILENTGLMDSMKNQAYQFAAIAAQFDPSAFVRQLNEALEGISWEQLRETIRRPLPSNIRSDRNLVAVADIALREGLPLAWVPRSEILDELIDASTPEDRVRILDAHAEDVLDDCEAVLNDIEHEWADQCRSAVRAFRAGFEAPAQSHAGNIVDSIILAILGPRGGRDLARERAQKDFDELPIHVIVENLVLRPLFLCFTNWFPDDIDSIPGHFARHTTAHAVGHPGVFSRHNSLVAVMLATSLTVQFWDEPVAPQITLLP